MANHSTDRFDSHSISQESNSEQNVNAGLDDMSDEQILNQIDEIIRSSQLLATENQVLDKFHKKIEPFMLAPIGGTTASSLSTTPSGSIYDLGAATSVTGGTSNRGYRKRSKSRSTHGDYRMRLTTEQKTDIIVKEIEEIKLEITKYDEENEKELDSYKAIYEETEVCLSEIKKEVYEFERDVCNGSVNEKTNKIMAEQFIKYMNDKMKSRESYIEKLRLKNSTLKKQKSTLTKQLKQKEELGEVLLEVDFKQLKIENKQYLERIEEKNAEMSKLKKMVGLVSQTLNSRKKHLYQCSKENETIKNEIKIRKSILEKLANENEVVDKEHFKEENKNRKLRAQLENYKVPAVNDYVTAEDSLYHLEKEVKVWERKVEIAEMAYKLSRQSWIQMKANTMDGYTLPKIQSAKQATGNQIKSQIETN